jgi:hypothetical protein
MDDEADQEVLSYDAFLNRQLRHAWRQRWRAHQWHEHLERSRAATGSRVAPPGPPAATSGGATEREASLR